MLIECRFNEGGGYRIGNFSKYRSPLDGIPVSSMEPEWTWGNLGWEFGFSTGFAWMYPQSNLYTTGTQPRTVLAVYETQAATVTDAIASVGTNATGAKWTFRTLNNALRLEISGSGYTSALFLSNGVTSFVGCTYTGGDLSTHRLFKDGTFEQATGANTVNTGSDRPWCFGVDAVTSNRATGNIMWGGIWDRALTDEEIMQVYESTNRQPARNFLMPPFESAPVAETYTFKVPAFTVH